MSDLTIPTRAIAQRSGLPYQTGIPESAGVLVALEVMPIAEAYRALTQVMNLGATMLTALQGNLSFPTHDSVAMAQWVNEGQALPDVTSELGSFTMSPNMTGAISNYTAQMLQQSSADLETWVRLDLATAVAESIDLAAVNGSGVGPTPRGILQTSGVNVVSIGPNGGPLTWANVVDFERLVAQANAIKPTSRLGYLTSAKVAAHMKVRERETGTGNYLWESSQIVSQGQRPGFGQVNSYPAAVSTHIPDNLSKGTGNSLSAVIFGDWSQLLIGEWGALQLDVNPYGRGWQSGSVEVRVMTLIDIAVRRPKAFSVSTDVNAA
ncbi:MAG: phage major capsid protein [Gloeomargaritaceae cyanobacterium C42_A2020_066]|nr:phage major capsid protein [Gloeomargaritaceae cyanobacterium C42_A2020_066]